MGVNGQMIFVSPITLLCQTTIVRYLPLTPANILRFLLLSLPAYQFALPLQEREIKGVTWQRRGVCEKKERNVCVLSVKQPAHSRWAAKASKSFLRSLKELVR